MAKFDAAEVSALLAIPALVTNNAPQMSAILAEAMARLHAINSGLAEEKARQPKSPHEYPGMPTHTHPVPSQPIEAPKSEAAKDAPKPDQDQPMGKAHAPRALPSSTYDDEPSEPVRRM